MTESTPPVPPAPDSDGKDSIRIEHAHRSFEHTQNVIQFVDGKTNVLIGLVTAMAAVTLYFFRIELGLEAGPSSEEAEASKGSLWWLTTITMSASLLAGAVSIILCAWTTLARPRFITGKSVLLFLSNSASSPAELDQKRKDASEALRNLNEDAILDEYADQLANLGSIVERKIRFYKRATYAFVTQMFLAVLAAVGWLLSWA